MTVKTMMDVQYTLGEASERFAPSGERSGMRTPLNADGGARTLATPGDAHKAALDALEGIARAQENRNTLGVCVDLVHGTTVEVLQVLVDAGRMEWTVHNGVARFVTPPKRLLSDEQVAEVLRLAGDWVKNAMEGAFANAHYRDKLRALLTSLTEAE